MKQRANLIHQLAVCLVTLPRSRAETVLLSLKPQNLVFLAMRAQLTKYRVATSQKPQPPNQPLYSATRFNQTLPEDCSETKKAVVCSAIRMEKTQLLCLGNRLLSSTRAIINLSSIVKVFCSEPKMTRRLRKGRSLRRKGMETALIDFTLRATRNLLLSP